MPNAPTHDRIAILSAPPLAVASGVGLAAAGIPLQEAAIATGLLTISHLVSSYWLSPDLDTDSAIAPRWGPIGLIWIPYQFIPHRSFLSHSGVSAILRLGYLAGVVSLAIWGLSQIWPSLWSEGQGWGLWAFAMAQRYPLYAGSIVGGAVFSDTIHVLADWILTHSKSTMRRILPRSIYRFIVRG